MPALALTTEFRRHGVRPQYHVNARLRWHLAAFRFLQRRDRRKAIKALHANVINAVEIHGPDVRQGSPDYGTRTGAPKERVELSAGDPHS